MGAVDAPGPRGHDKKKGKKKKKRRVGVRIDNTPMVDVAFLLLTFFMLTTTMNKPQTMEINLPPSNDVTVEVAMSNLMTLLVKEDGSIYWNIGVDPPEKVAFKGLRALDERAKPGESEADHADQDRPQGEVPDDGRHHG